MSEEPSETPRQGHEHGKPADIRQYFDQQNLAQRYNLHQEANKIDLAALTDEIAFSKETDTVGGESYRVQLETERLHGAGAPGTLSTASDTSVDAELTIAEQEALLGWLADVEDQAGDEDDAAALRRRLAGVLAICRRRSSATSRPCYSWKTRSSRRAGCGPPRWTGSPKSSVPSWKSPCAGWRGRCTARSRTGAESPPPAGSTPAAPCGATRGSTECRSCRSRCGAPRTGHGWSYSLT